MTFNFNFFSRFRRSNKGVIGLILVTLVVCMNLVVIYFFFSFITPVMGAIGPRLGAQMLATPGIDPGFVALFFNGGRWTYFDMMGAIFGGIVIASVATIILYAARRHDTDDLIQG